MSESLVGGGRKEAAGKEARSYLSPAFTLRLEFPTKQAWGRERAKEGRIQPNKGRVRPSLRLRGDLRARNPRVERERSKNLDISAEERSRRYTRW